MIHVLLTARHSYTIEQYLTSGGAALAGRLRVHTYEDVVGRRTLPPGTWILTDFERLSCTRLERVEEIADAIDADPASRLLNHPRRCLGRHALLDRLHRAGVNPYRAHRVDGLPDDLRLPVFLRLENDHQGSRTGLLESRSRIEAEVRRLERRGKDRADLIAVEFHDTADADGIYRKYGAFHVAGTVVPRHVFFGPKWNLKNPSSHLDSHFAEELAVVDDNPHAAAIRDVFSIAGIDFGRLDYAMDGERLVVWEINTNPMISIPLDATTGVPGQVNALFHERFRGALEAVDCAGAGPIGLPRARVALRDRWQDVRTRWRVRKRTPPAD